MNLEFAQDTADVLLDRLLADSQGLGLPLFVTGLKVTVEMVVEALRVLLPPELQFLISNRGTRFKANAFKMLMLSEEFIHVFTARHRPQSNSIVERFMRALKEWLADKSCQMTKN